MGRLLLFAVFSLLSLKGIAQGDDPLLIDRNGYPVIVPSKAPTMYNQSRDTRIPLRRDMEPARSSQPDAMDVYEAEEMRRDNTYQADTITIYYFDAEGRPIRNIADIYRDLAEKDDSVSSPPMDSSYRHRTDTSRYRRR